MRETPSVKRLFHYSLIVVSNIANRLSQPRQSSRLQPSSWLTIISSESESELCEHFTPYSLMQQVNGRQEPGPILWGSVLRSAAVFDFRSSRSPQRMKSFSFKCLSAVLFVRRLHRHILVSWPRKLWEKQREADKQCTHSTGSIQSRYTASAPETKSGILSLDPPGGIGAALSTRRQKRQSHMVKPFMSLSSSGTACLEFLGTAKSAILGGKKSTTRTFDR